MLDYGCDVQFIDIEYIDRLLQSAKGASGEEIEQILDKADRFEGLTHHEVAVLLQTDDTEYINGIFEVAGKIKRHIYGERIVMFAPLYVSDYCVNKCLYCGFRCDHEYPRRRLAIDEIREEVRILEA